MSEGVSVKKRKVGGGHVVIMTVGSESDGVTISCPDYPKRIDVSMQFDGGVCGSSVEQIPLGEFLRMLEITAADCAEALNEPHHVTVRVRSRQPFADGQEFWTSFRLDGVDIPLRDVDGIYLHPNLEGDDYALVRFLDWRDDVKISNPQWFGPDGVTPFNREIHHGIVIRGVEAKD